MNTETPFQSKAIDATKGFLLLLIVLGHNTYLAKSYRPVYDAIYSFHVIGFFILSGLLAKARPMTLDFIRDRAVRYLVPFSCFFLFYTVLYSVAFTPDITFVSWLSRTLQGWFIASGRLIDAACGLKMLWFLPTLFSFVILLNALLPRQNAILLGILILIHGCIGWSSLELKFYAPLGILIVLYVLPLVLGMRMLQARLGRHFTPLPGLIYAIVWILLAIFAHSIGGYLYLSEITVYSWSNPLLLLLYDALALLAFIAIYSLSPWLAAIPGIVFVGRNSLLIYLVHSLVFQILMRLFLKIGMDHGLTTLAASYALTLFGSVLAVLILKRLPKLEAVVLPKDYPAWKQALCASVAVAGGWKARKKSSSSK